MTCLKSRTLLASLGGLALLLASGEAFAAGPGVSHGGGFAGHPGSHPGMNRSFGHHRGRHLGGGFWPGYYGDYGYGSAPVEPGADVAAPASGDVHYTYSYDVPWDHTHRFPPNVVPSDRPYVPDCTTQNVTVPRFGGSAQTSDINITRCY